MRAVLDTNVLISAVISTGVSHNVLVRGFQGEYHLLASIETINEFRETLLKYPEKFHLSADEIDREVETVQYYVDFIEPAEEITEIDADPDDDMFLEVAVAGDADYIVSGDSHLLDLGSFRGVLIVDPRTFLETLENR